MPARIVLIGWGAIARRTAELVDRRGVAARIQAVCGRAGVVRPGTLPEGADWLTGPDGLAELAPDLVIEAASREAVEHWGPAALACCDYAVCSTSAFSDDPCRERLLELARACGHRVILPPGALGGIDALAAAAILSIDEVVHTIAKPPAGWRGTEAERVVDLDAQAEAVCLFEGSARDAADRYPKNANSTVTSALAGIGLDRTRVRLVSDPSIGENEHRIEARGDFGELSVRLKNRPMAANPRTSELTALSLVRLIENRTGALSR